MLASVMLWRGSAERECNHKRSVGNNNFKSHQNKVSHSEVQKQNDKTPSLTVMGIKNKKETVRSEFIIQFNYTNSQSQCEVLEAHHHSP